jgi:hypothetical protein
MDLLTEPIRSQLLANGREQARRTADGETHADFVPVVKLCSPFAPCTWILTELDPEDPDIAFGLADLGLQCAELGSISLAEIAETSDKLGLAIHPDPDFKPRYPISVYARAAWHADAITEDRHALANAAAQIEAEAKAERKGGAS